MRQPKIRNAIIMLVGGLLCTLVFLLVFQFDRGMKAFLVQREQDNIKQQAQVASAIFYTSMRTLPDITKDWSRWDASYNFLAGKNPDFIVDDLNEDLLLLHRLNFALVLDENGAVKYQNFFDFVKEEEMEPSIDLILMLEDFKLKAFQGINGVKLMNMKNPVLNGVSGFIVCNDTWFYISAYPVLRSDGKGDANGVLLFGRIIDDREIARMKEGVDTIEVHRLPNAEADVLFAEGLFRQEPFWVRYASKDTIKAYHKIDVVYGDNLVFFIEKPRGLYKQGLHVIRLLNLSILLTAVVVLVLLFFLLEKLLLGPLKNIAKWVEKIEDAAVWDDSPTYWGYELNAFIEALRKMFKKLTHTQKIIEEQNKNMRYIINHDALTGLPNTLSYSCISDGALADARKVCSKVYFLYIHIVNLRLINDTLGHSAGDAILVELAERLKMFCSDAISVACVDGHKLAVLYGEDQVEKEGIEEKCEAIISMLKVPLALENCQIQIALAIGISTYPTDSQDAAELHRNASLAANAALSAKVEYLFYKDSLLRAVLNRINMEEALSKAIEQNELVPFFQPKLDLKTSKITGSEALVRWLSPEGIIAPGVFIPVAIETGLIIQITWLMLEKACVENRRFAAEGFDISVSVNVPVQVILHTDFVQRTLLILEKTGMIPPKLDIEITEETLIADVEKVSEVMEELQSHGIEVSVDDFGTGYSSLQYLKNMPFNAMKIDKAFVDGIPDDKYNEAIIKASVELAKALNLKVIVEGVETKEQWDIIKKIGCHELQGYVVSKPVFPDKFIDLLHRWND